MNSEINANLDVMAQAHRAVGDWVVDHVIEGFGVDDDTSMPAELRNWLVRLRLLEGVPFANLVADSELLPPESIRWFYLDRRWTDAIVQGALSVGTINTDDRTILTANYPAIRSELDHEERNVRVAAPSSGAGAAPARSADSCFGPRRCRDGPVCTCGPSTSTRRPRTTAHPTPRHPRATPAASVSCGSNGSPPPCCCACSTAFPKRSISRNPARASSSASTPPPTAGAGCRRH